MVLKQVNFFKGPIIVKAAHRHKYENKVSIIIITTKICTSAFCDRSEKVICEPILLCLDFGTETLQSQKISLSLKRLQAKLKLNFGSCWGRDSTCPHHARKFSNWQEEEVKKYPND